MDAAAPLVNDDEAPAAGPAERGTRGALARALRRLGLNPDALAAVLDASADAMIAFDETRRILHANTGAESLFGHARHALVGVTTDVLLPERLRQPEAPPMLPVVDLIQIDLAGLRVDGSELAVEWLLGSVARPAGAGHLFVMTVRDRAAIDRAIEDLRESEERFRLLVEGVQEYAIFMLDPEGRVSSWNKGAERTNGWAEREILGQPYEVFFAAEEGPELPRRHLEAAARDGNHDVSGWRVRKDGSRFRATAYLTPLRTSTGELRGFAEVTRDLTERLQAEDLERRLRDERASREAAEAAELRVRESEERLRRLQRITAALTEAATPSDVASVVLDQSLEALGAGGGAIYSLESDGLTLALLEQRGRTIASLAGFNRIALDAPSPLSDSARERKPAFYESFETCVRDYPTLRDALSLAGFEAAAALPLLTHGALRGVLWIRFRESRDFDLSDRVLLLTLAELCAQALERARLFAAERAARAEAEAANRSKDEFLAMLGHELRNPLAPIVTALSLMKLRDGEGRTDRERTVIERQVTHLVRLVDDLLDVSRITRGKVELKKRRVELAEVVAKAVELASPLLEQRQHHLSLNVPALGMAVNGDETRLSQVVSNLITNSAKYTPQGGHIEVTASRRDGTVVLTVRDDGMGISAEMLPRIFDLFAQEEQPLERSQGGLGLGLAIVKSLVTMHDGRVSASSGGHGQGTVVTVELPAAAAPAPVTASDTPPSVRPRKGTGRRVLVVDDNVDAAQLLAEVLRMWGHDAVIAHDGGAALALAATFRPEIALLDIGLPVMDGYELAPKLKAEIANVRLVAVTGYGQAADRARTQAAGFDAHLVKPVQLGELEGVLG